MFNCQRCKKTQPPRTKVNKISVETRPVAYTKTIRDRDSGGETIVEVGHGHEIVKELTVCEKCKNAHEKKHSELGTVLKAA